MIEHQDLLLMLPKDHVNDAKFRERKKCIKKENNKIIFTSSSVARFLSICISNNFSIAGSVVKFFRIISSVISCINFTYCKRSCLNKINIY
jgi:hypothetical protein